MWWHDGGISISLGWKEPHPGRGGGEGDKGPFGGSQRRETTLYLTQNSAGWMGAQLGSEKQLDEEDSNAISKRSLGTRRLSPARKKHCRQVWGRAKETEREQRPCFLHSAMTNRCLHCPHRAVFIPGRSWKRESSMKYTVSYILKLTVGRHPRERPYANARKSRQGRVPWP